MSWKLFEGDCLDILPSIEDKSIDLIITDIPYNEVNMKDGIRKLNRGKADKLDFDLNTLLDECIRITNGSIYIFCGIGQISHIRNYFKEHKLSTRHLIWEKTNPSPLAGQYLWLSSIENCVYAKKPKATFNGHCLSSVFRFPCGSSKRHPTEKPLKVFEYLIGMSSNAGDTVLDMCAGSGTTAEACYNLNHNSILIEKEPEYCEIIKDRMNNLTSQTHL